MLPRSVRTLGLIAATGLPLALPAVAEEAPGASPRPPVQVPAPETRREVEASVRELARPGLQGRDRWESRKEAAAWIAARFAALGLQPPPGRKSLLLDLGGSADVPEARHVVAWLPGRSAQPGEPGEYVLLGSHYDGVGDTYGQVCPGADDNASGIAALLETARLLLQRSHAAPLRRSVLFVAFDGKNRRNQGPERFVAEPPLPLASCVAMISIEMLGRSLLDLLPGRLFAMGGEFSAELDGLLDRLGPPPQGSLGRPEIDIHIEASSYGPFQDRSIPFLLVTAGFTIDRNLPADDADGVDYGALAARTAWIATLVQALADLPTRPAWREKAAPRIEELRLIRELTSLTQQQLEARGASDVLQQMAAAFAQRLDALIAKGAVTRPERDAIQRLAVAIVRQILATAR